MQHYSPAIHHYRASPSQRTSFTKSTSRQQLNPSLIFVTPLVNNIPLRAMIDTGATNSFITQRALSRLHHSAIYVSQRSAQLGDGHTTLKIIGEAQLLLKFHTVYTPIKALFVKQLNADFILGSDWCTQNSLGLEYDKNRVSISSPNGRLFIPYDTSIEHTYTT